MKFSQSLIVIVTSLISLQGFAGQIPPGVVDLVHRRARPTVQEIVSTLGQQNLVTQKNPLPVVDYNLVGGSLLTAFYTSLPRVIAQFEKAYPGAIYLGLGRDSALLSDAIDAFYLGLGQSGRSKMLGASGGTFNNNPTDETIVAFLEGYGFSLDNIANARPFVIFDGTRFNPTSQSRRIMSAIYRVAAKRGIDLKTLVRKVNFVSTAFDGYKYYPKNLIAQTNVDSYFKGQAQVIDHTGPSEILAVDGWLLTHGYNWTDTYGPFVNSQGKIVGSPGALMSEQERLYALAQQIEMIRLTNTQQFVDRVEAESKTLGFSFREHLRLYNGNVEVAKVEPVIKMPPRDHDKDLNANLKALTGKLNPLNGQHEYGKFQVGNEKIRLTKNGYEVVSLLTSKDSVQAKNHIGISFDFLVEQFREDKIGARDFRRIFVHLLEREKITDPDFFAYVRSFYKEILPVEITLGRADERQKYSSGSANLSHNYNELVKNGNLPLSCRFAYSN